MRTCARRRAQDCHVKRPRYANYEYLVHKLHARLVLTCDASVNVYEALAGRNLSILSIALANVRSGARDILAALRVVFRPSIVHVDVIVQLLTLLWGFHRLHADKSIIRVDKHTHGREPQRIALAVVEGFGSQSRSDGFARSDHPTQSTPYCHGAACFFPCQTVE